MLLTTCVNILLIAVVVLIHYEAFKLISHLVARITRGQPIRFKSHALRHRVALFCIVFGAIIAHIVEVWIYALAYYLMINVAELGQLHGADSNSFLDMVYFSFTTYTSLGLGDIAPISYVRYIVGLESLTGLVLITWTASFLVLEMQKVWPSISHERT